VFAAMNAQFAPGRTGFEWLSRDDREVDLYVADPGCGFSLVPESFGDLLAHGARMADPHAIGGIRKDLPVYITSGDHDPLVALLHGLDPLIERYRQAGLNVTVKMYPEGRHEILNETNRSEVVADLQRWIDGVTRGH
jgi:alpha-beta hydrolase superfamily lysophospholipase